VSETPGGAEAAPRRDVVVNHRRLRRRPVLVVVALAVLLVACGRGDPEDGIAIEDVTEPSVSEGVVEPPPEEESAEPPEEEPEEEVEEGGVRNHRPPDAAAAFAGCDRIDDAAPGAVIRFPSEEVAGSLDAGSGPVTVEVVGCGNTFEANVQWEAYHGQNRNPTLEGHTMGGTMGDWGTFSIAETYWTPGDWTVVVFEVDAESGERREYDRVTFSVD
jgi:hypothetical protein